MADEARSETRGKRLGSWLDRVGAALAAPRLALEESDTPAGQGRAASDIALLLLLAVLAVETELMVMAGWLLVDGDWSGGLSVVVMGARDHLAMPIVLLLAGSIVLSLSAGSKRRISDDFDLSSVALTPLVVLELANALLFLAGVSVHRFAQVLGYGWFALLLFLAWQQARSRSPKS